MNEPVELLKDAIIAEVAADVLKIRDNVEEIGPLVAQLRDQLPGHFDLLRAGLIETLDAINEGIKEAGGERIEFVKGQLSVFIEQAIDKAFAANSDKVEKMVAQFERQNNAAAANLKAQFDEVSEGMTEIKKIVENARFPTWAKVIIPIALVVAIGCSAVVTWQVASYKEAMYMQAFMKQLEADKGKRTK
ncbi:TPA: hypothetical protein L5627_006018 [Pseudomonas aeruginosa]|uniref:hypothetical protein n=1 Tax=Pseudomonas aeruginosa TaxID=287 RepID=UPI000E6A39DE|nr:hypothetical protein [Pseudomonas aeruginosa]RIY89738.1 hypothetical protein AXW94_30155 [Pseudomonas aeruginosa]RPM25834.1 hypothetical protein IPC1293_31175 [Pseudomonas aeruginosa]HBP4970080.1 hypothetical protein [Pseudomonas aeruginosa]HCT4783441.1 hypothetical protein [Pseudomonas aeruginosa]